MYTETLGMLDFAAGKIRVLISKPTICGFGMNFQVCHNVVFVGLSDSYEQFYLVCSDKCKMEKAKKYHLAYYEKLKTNPEYVI